LIEQLRAAPRARELAITWLRDRLKGSEQAARRFRAAYQSSPSLIAACEVLAQLDDVTAGRCRELIARLEQP
jgi:hypothetical protein